MTDILVASESCFVNRQSIECIDVLERDYRLLLYVFELWSSACLPYSSQSHHTMNFFKYSILYFSTTFFYLALCFTWCVMIRVMMKILKKCISVMCKYDKLLMKKNCIALIIDLFIIPSHSIKCVLPTNWAKWIKDTFQWKLLYHRGVLLTYFFTQLLFIKYV